MRQPEYTGGVEFEIHLWSSSLKTAVPFVGGVDLIPYKHCSFDCIYCQLGATVHKRAERQQFVETGEVIAELESALPCVEADYVTLSGGRANPPYAWGG